MQVDGWGVLKRRFVTVDVYGCDKTYKFLLSYYMFVRLQAQVETFFLVPSNSIPSTALDHLVG